MKCWDLHLVGSTIVGKIDDAGYLKLTDPTVKHSLSLDVVPRNRMRFELTDG